ncbi:hypothetical protein Pan216_04330 [Planctomycetes bacterium Pan216]|uniref:Uncharacterized protein n=1 Tax=Kolteria novifilia TaxID=2527975 RepID=A0A518AY03_9BACT|nr:hypothetical protein Pan216_04330 [Planctomycetes bacterium Pan216]
MQTSDKTISQVFDEFLSDQEDRLKPKTFAKYRSIIDLFESYLESYWPSHDQDEYKKITGNGGTFCGTFGPEEILGGYSEFLGYFMPHKVMCGKDTMQAAGTVTKKLAKWLAEKGYVEDASFAEDRAGEAAKELPAAQDVLDLLDEFVDLNAPDDYEDEIQDHFWIKKIEPGKLWLEALTMHDGVIGPVPVPKKVTQIVKEMWDIGGVIVKTSRGWRFLEVWKVSP